MLATSAIRVRRLKRSLRLPQHVADAAERMDERPGPGLLELASQVPDVDAQRVGCRPEVVAPDALVDEPVGQDAARVAQEQLEQLVLGAGEFDELLVHRYAVPCRVERELLERQLRRLARVVRRRAPQQGADA